MNDTLKSRLRHQLPDLVRAIGETDLPGADDHSWDPGPLHPGRERPSRQLAVAGASVAACVLLIAGVYVMGRSSSDGDVVAGEPAPDESNFEAMPGAAITLDYLSGAPNPQWPLDIESFSELAEAVDRLQAEPQSSVPDGGLGFRGVLVTFTQEGDSEPTLWSFDGTTVVVEEPGSPAEVLSDSDGNAMRVAVSAITARTAEPTYVELLGPWLD